MRLDVIEAGENTKQEPSTSLSAQASLDIAASPVQVFGETEKIYGYDNLRVRVRMIWLP